MANGDGYDWWGLGTEVAKWLLAGIAALGSSAALVIGRRYRKDTKRLEETYAYVLALKKRRAAARIVAYRKELRELKKQYAASERRNEQLQDLVRTNNNKIQNYESTCQNLISLVDIRAKEHHEFRNLLQSFVGRLIIVETRLNIKHANHDDE